MRPEHAFTIPKHIVEALPTFVTPVLSVRDVFALILIALSDPYNSQHLQATPTGWCANSFNAVAMAYDSATVIFARRIIRRDGPSLYWQMWVHHFVDVFLSFLRLYYDQAIVAVMWLSEARKIIMNHLGMGHRSTVNVTVLWFLLFVTIRVLPAPLLLWCFVAGRASQPVVRSTGQPTPFWVVAFHALTAATMCGLNGFWFYRASNPMLPSLLSHFIKPAPHPLHAKGGQHGATRKDASYSWADNIGACPPLLKCHAHTRTNAHSRGDEGYACSMITHPRLIIRRVRPCEPV